MTKQEKVKKLIQDIDNVELIKIYFDWLKSLIDHLGISNEDKRLTLNVRFASVKRFSTILNSRLVFGLGFYDSKLMIMVMINEKDINFIGSHYLLEHFKGKKDFLVYLTPNQFFAISKRLKNKWLKCCETYLPTEKTSRFRNNHVPFLYEMAVNKNAKEKNLNLDSRPDITNRVLISKTEMEVNKVEMDDLELEGYEGKTKELIQKHLKKERDLLFIRKYRHKYESIKSCPACNFNATNHYGIKDSNSILEIHHIIPLKQRIGEYKIMEKDVTFLCPNCHRTIHKMMATEKNVTISLRKFKKRIKI